MNSIADQLTPAIARSTSLREVYLGDNPWTEPDWKAIVNAFVKPTPLKILGLGLHTYLTEDVVMVPEYIPNIRWSLKMN